MSCSATCPTSGASPAPRSSPPAGSIHSTERWCAGMRSWRMRWGLVERYAAGSALRLEGARLELCRQDKRPLAARDLGLQVGEEEIAICNFASRLGANQVVDNRLQRARSDIDVFGSDVARPAVLLFVTHRSSIVTGIDRRHEAQVLRSIQFAELDALDGAADGPQHSARDPNLGLDGKAVCREHFR